MKLVEQLSELLNEGLGLDVKTEGTSVIFKNESDKKKAFKKLSKEGMTGLSKQTGLKVNFTDVETLEQVLDILESK